MPAERTDLSAWRFFPMAIIGALLFVIAVNGAMIAAAVNGFPGKVGNNGFDLSNQYNAILVQEERAASLGWEIDASLRGGRPVLRLLDASGQDLKPTRLTVEVRRPVGPPDRRVLSFADVGDGSRVATTVLDRAGQWDMLITVHARGAELTTRRRLYVP